MRLLLVLVLSLSPAVFAQEAEHKGAEEHKGGEHSEPSILWKWANFALLAGILGYLGKKQAGPYFASRNAEIQSGLADARKLREDAETRVAGIERQVANLQTAMQAMREESRQEMASEAERIKTETARTLAKIQSNAQQEIESAVKLARQELKAYSADLAIQLATSQIRERLNPTTQDQLVNGFVSQLAAVQKATH